MAVSARTILRRTLAAGRRTRYNRSQRRRRRRRDSVAFAFAATTTAGFGPTVIGIRVACAGAGHERCRIDGVVRVGIHDHGGGAGVDGDGVCADGQLGCVVVAWYAHPEVEVRGGFRSAGFADVLDGEVFLEALGVFFFLGQLSFPLGLALAFVLCV